jgi:hypothetical protein
LLNRCIEGIEVGVKDGGYCVHPDRLRERKIVPQSHTDASEPQL